MDSFKSIQFPFSSFIICHDLSFREGRGLIEMGGHVQKFASRQGLGGVGVLDKGLNRGFTVA